MKSKLLRVRENVSIIKEKDKERGEIEKAKLNKLKEKEEEQTRLLWREKKRARNYQKEK